MAGWYRKDGRRRWAATPTQVVTLQAAGWVASERKTPAPANKAARKAPTCKAPAKKAAASAAAPPPAPEVSTTAQTEPGEATQ